jgi:hypothetical protein
MNATHLRVRARSIGEHVYVTVFAGVPESTFESAGVLSFRLTEWPAMRELLFGGRGERVQLYEEGEAARV